MNSHPINLLINYLEKIKREGQSRLILSDESKTALNLSLSRENLFLLRKNKERELTLLKDNMETYFKENKIPTLRYTLVYSVGNPNSEILFIGEAPGFEEERQVMPFVGKSGQLFTKILGAMQINREDIYITNFVKYRPLIENQHTNNRKPSFKEMMPFYDWVQKEVDIISPKIIVTLGATALSGLIRREKIAITKERGKFFDFNGVPILPTFHPSYILRQNTLRAKRQIWEDMLSVMSFLNRPISTKQRNYFSK